MMFYAGLDFGPSRQPLFAAARKLLADGLAEPDDRIETWRGNTLCLSGPVWAAAKLSVNGAGPKFARYESSQQIKQRFVRAASTADALFSKTGAWIAKRLNSYQRGLRRARPSQQLKAT